MFYKKNKIIFLKSFMRANDCNEPLIKQNNSYMEKYFIVMLLEGCYVTSEVYLLSFLYQNLTAFML